MAVITISRQFGAGGRTLGKMLSEKLNYVFLDDSIIQEISQKANVSTDWVKSMERTAGGLLSKFFSKAISRSYMERLVGGSDKGYLDEEVYIEKLNEVILEFANRDNVVLMGRGSQYILSDFKGAIHVLLVAEKKDRIKFMQQFYDMTDAQAEQAVKRGEKMRVNLYNKLGKEDYNDPSLYSLVINTSKMTLNDVVRMINVLVCGETSCEIG